MIRIDEYIQKPKQERQAHLKLDESCIERGGMSSYFKGLLAHILNTTIPSGRKIQVCHACHNGGCSNPNHLYWGTPKENRADAIANGAPNSPVEALKRRGNTEVMARIGNKNGEGNRGGKKSEEHRQKIADAIRRKHAEGKYENVALGRKSGCNLGSKSI